ncbi:anthrone oxygenase family protein [Spirosoma areae]
MPAVQNIILTSAATTTALMAGLFYAYSCSVNPGLHRLPDAAYLAAMQSINRAILNPVFFIGFLGTALLLPLSVWVHYGQPVSVRFWLLLGATVVYVGGVLGVTMLGNVPLNEALDAFDLQTASVAGITTQRTAFEVPWNKLNTVRTVASVVALILVIAACLSPKAD